MPQNSVAVSQDEQLFEDIVQFIHDPLGFVRYAFPWGHGELATEDGPDEWQIDILETIGEKLRAGEVSVYEAIQIAVASGHGIGKSALVAWIVLWAICTCTDTKGVVTANTENQLKTKTWAELSKWYRLCICKHWFVLTATALFSADPEHAKEWRIDQVPWSENNTESFAGLHNKGKRIILIFDESSAIHDKIWEVSEGALTDEDTEIIWCAFGNPTRNSGRFKDCFTRFRHRWIRKQIDSRTSRHTNKQKIQEWIDDYGENSDFVKVRVRGVFPSMSVRQLIGVEDVDAACGRTLDLSQYSWAPKILSVDPAWEGDDELVIGMRQGLLFRVLRTMEKNDNDLQVATIIADLEDSEGADAVFVDAGYGTGIVSAGRTMKRNWQLVWFSGRSMKGTHNKRAEMWVKMRDWLKSGGCIPKDDHILYQDLIGPELVPRDDGVLQLESKKDMKKRQVPSPNRADALALTFAYPVMSKRLGRRKGGQRTAGFSNFENAHVPDDYGDYKEVYVA